MVRLAMLQKNNPIIATGTSVVIPLRFNNRTKCRSSWSSFAQMLDCFLSCRLGVKVSSSYQVPVFPEIFWTLQGS